MRSLYRPHVVFAAIVVAAVAPAHAQPASSTPAHHARPSCIELGAMGTVFERRGDVIFIDLGSDHGVTTGATLEVLDVVGDNAFRIGNVTAVQLGAQLSALTLGSLSPDAQAKVSVGDCVNASSRQPSMVDPWKAYRYPMMSKPVTAQEADALIEGFSRAAGKSLQDQIELWGELQQQLGNDRLTEAVGRYLDWLRASRDRVDREIARTVTERAERQREALTALEPDVTDQPLALRAAAFAYEGQELPIAVVVLEPRVVAWVTSKPGVQAWLYVRDRAGAGFQRTPLARDGDSYLRGVIPSQAVQAPRVEYFIEVLGPAGTGARVSLGDEQHPLSTKVAVDPARPQAPARAGRTLVRLRADYVDFDGGLAGGFDQYAQTDADFCYEFGAAIHRFCVGFGSMSGRGGPKDVIDKGDCANDSSEACREVSFSYFYTELALALSEQFALSVRPVLGVRSIQMLGAPETLECVQEGVLGDVCRTLGLRAHLRVGYADQTNLRLGVELTSNLGTQFEAAFDWNVIDKVPITLSTQVTDQPVPGDFGIRILADVGLRATPWFIPSARLSVQARDADHAGISGGLGTTFRW
jgi:hypothetical protein